MENDTRRNKRDSQKCKCAGTSMNCRLHVSTPMTAIRQRIPFQSIDGPQEGERVVYRCPAPGCHIVGYEYETERVDSRYCNVCGARIEGRDNITDHRCKKCCASQRRSRDIPLAKLIKRDGHKLPRSMWKRRRRINKSFVGATKDAGTLHKEHA